MAPVRQQDEHHTDQETDRQQDRQRRDTPATVHMPRKRKRCADNSEQSATENAQSTPTWIDLGTHRPAAYPAVSLQRDPNRTLGEDRRSSRLGARDSWVPSAHWTSTAYGPNASQPTTR